MHARAEIRLIIAALFVNQVVLAFASIGLLTRITPAVEGIINENVVSIEAVEQMFAGLAAPTVDDGVRESFAAGLRQAESNVTEPSETPQIAVLNARSKEALDGDAEARRATVDALVHLGRINVESVRRADRKAQQLGAAGAWISAFLGALGFMLSVMAVRRVTRRFLEPLNELALTVEAYREGDVHRRFGTRDAPIELQRIGETINALLLDKAGTTTEPCEAEVADRAATLFFLDTLTHPALLVHRSGVVAASNIAGENALRSETGQALRATVKRIVAGEPAPEGIRARDVRGKAFLVELVPTAAGGDADSPGAG